MGSDYARGHQEATGGIIPKVSSPKNVQSLTPRRNSLYCCKPWALRKTRKGKSSPKAVVPVFILLPRPPAIEKLHTFSKPNNLPHSGDTNVLLIYTTLYVCCMPIAYYRLSSVSASTLSTQPKTIECSIRTGMELVVSSMHVHGRTRLRSVWRT